MKSGLIAIYVFMLLFFAVGIFKFFAQVRPYEKMKLQIANLPKGTNLQQVKTRIDRGPEVSCLSMIGCKKLLQKQYKRYNPDPGKNVRGPVLVYRMAGVDHIHCLYFNEESQLVEISESTM